MKLVKLTAIFLVTSVLPMLVIYLLAGGYTLYTSLVVWISFWFLLFTFSDKFILLFLGAREIIDADHWQFFQALNSEIYRSFEKIPKVYLYSGLGEKCFVLESRSEWSIVLDRNLLSSLSDEQIQSLVKYLVKFKKQGNVLLQTKGMGLTSVVIRSIYWLSGLMAFSRDSNFFKTLVFIGLVLIKPIIDFLLIISKSKKRIECGECLRSIFFQIDQSEHNKTFIEFMLYHLEKDINLKELLVDYLEQFPVIENCKFQS